MERMELAYSNTNINGKQTPKAKVIAVTSGKGGVGKSSTATNLALSLSSLNKKVCIFDADASLANINILLGIQPKYTLQHLLTGERPLKDIIIDGPRGVKIVPGATGIAEYARLSDEQKTILLAALDKLQQEFDYLIIDTAAGIGDDVLDFVKASQFSIVIITPEPTSLTDSFSLLKVLKRSNFSRTTYVLVNMAMDNMNGQAIYNRFESAVKKYIDVDISYLGYIQVDETMISSVSLQCPAVLLNPDSTASQCFQKLAERFEKNNDGCSIDSFSDFWRQQDIEPLDSPQIAVESVTPTFASDDVNTTQSKSTPAVAALDFSQASDFCIQQLTSGDLTSDESAHFFDAINQFQAKESVKSEIESAHTTSSVREFYKFLEKNSFPQDDLREIVATLEQVYVEKYGKSLNSVESATLKLLAQFNGSEDDLRYVNERLSESYQGQFNKPLYSVIDEIHQLAEADGFDKAAFDKILAELLSVYQRKFTVSYETEADKELALAHQTIKDLQERHQSLSKELQISQQSLTERATILDKIKQLLPEVGKKP
ncbi:MAG: P-loop NTPase [Cycloclasticus sp.]